MLEPHRPCKNGRKAQKEKGAHHGGKPIFRVALQERIHSQRPKDEARSHSYFRTYLPAVLGAPGRPLGRERHLAKFRCAAASGLRPMSASAMDHLVRLVDDLEQLDELQRLVDALVFDTDTP